MSTRKSAWGMRGHVTAAALGFVGPFFLPQGGPFPVAPITRPPARAKGYESRGTNRSQELAERATEDEPQSL